MNQTSAAGLKSYLSDVKDMIQQSSMLDNNSTDKDKKMDIIIHKLEEGEELSSSDLSYLRDNNPELYQEALRIQIERKSFEESLKNSSSKEEAQDKYSFQLNIISGSKNSIKYRVAAAKRVWKSFVNSMEYKKLPLTSDEENNTSETYYPCYNRNGNYD